MSGSSVKHRFGLGGAPMSVSLCLMVRNEEAKLATCLQSAIDLVHETIVLDTGSTDGTRDLAAKLGARVFDFPWCDDFAAVRNDCIRHATGDFIFWMDADERVDEENREKLRALFESTEGRQKETNHGTHGSHGNELSSLPSVSSVFSVVNKDGGNLAFVMKCLSVQPGET